MRLHVARPLLSLILPCFFLALGISSPGCRVQRAPLCRAPTLLLVAPSSARWSCVCLAATRFRLPRLRFVSLPFRVVSSSPCPRGDCYPLLSHFRGPSTGYFIACRLPRPCVQWFAALRATRRTFPARPIFRLAVLTVSCASRWLCRVSGLSYFSFCVPLPIMVLSVCLPPFFWPLRPTTLWPHHTTDGSIRFLRPLKLGSWSLLRFSFVSFSFYLICCHCRPTFHAALAPRYLRFSFSLSLRLFIPVPSPSLSFFPLTFCFDSQPACSCCFCFFFFWPVLSLCFGALFYVVRLAPASLLPFSPSCLTSYFSFHFTYMSHLCS